MTLISDLLTKGPTFSFEFFPPKNDTEQATLVRTLRDLEVLSPSFVSVTYRGGRESRQRTFDLVTGMLRTTTLTPMAHLICVAHTRLELAEILVAYRKAGVENLMALGGDIPDDPEFGEGDLSHAFELVEHIGRKSIDKLADDGLLPTSAVDQLIGGETVVGGNVIDVGVLLQKLNRFGIDALSDQDRRHRIIHVSAWSRSSVSNSPTRVNAGSLVIMPVAPAWIALAA